MNRAKSSIKGIKEKKSMQLQIYRVKNLTVGKKRYILYIPRKRYIQRNLFIYHCGDVSGEVPPVLIPNTVVKLTCADNT